MDMILFFLLGLLIGILNQRWIYFRKTGLHLPDLRPICKHNFESCGTRAVKCLNCDKIFESET